MPSTDDEDCTQIIKDVARFYGVHIAEKTDTFGRRYLLFDREAMQRMHVLVLRQGHADVAQDIREMLSRSERRSTNDI